MTTYERGSEREPVVVDIDMGVGQNHGYRDASRSVKVYPGEPPTRKPRERCEPILNEAGEVIAIARVSEDITDEGRAALHEVITAARRRFEADCAADPSVGVRQAEAVERVLERGLRLRGEDGVRRG